MYIHTKTTINSTQLLWSTNMAIGLKITNQYSQLQFNIYDKMHTDI